MDYAPRFGDNRAEPPGGHVDRADTDLERAFRREVLEECGVQDIFNMTQVGAFMHDRGDRIIVGYSGKLGENDKPVAADPTKEIPVFATKDQLGQYAIASCYLSLLEQCWPQD